MVIFDAENGRDPKAVDGFIEALSDAANNIAYGGCDVIITVGNIQLKAYDHAALIQGLLDAVEYFRAEL